MVEKLEEQKTVLITEKKSLISVIYDLSYTFILKVFFMSTILLFFLSGTNIPLLKLDLPSKYMLIGFGLTSLFVAIDYFVYKDINKLILFSMSSFDIKDIKKISIKTVKSCLRKTFTFNQIEKMLCITIAILIMSAVVLPVIANSILHYHTANGDIARSSTEITNGKTDDYSKTLAIIDWQKQSIINSYGKNIQIAYSSCSIALPSQIAWPQIALYNGGSDRGNWTIINKAGACGDNAYAFMQLADYNNIPVRIVAIPAEDHSFDEVYIDGEWRVVDLTNPYNGSFGYSPYWYSSPEGWASLNQISFAYAIYPNSSIDTNITYRYTNVSDLNIHVIDAVGNPVANTTVKVFSNNRDEPSRKHIYTNLSKVTNSDGNCTFTLGYGNCSFEASNATMSGKLDNIIINGSSNNSATIKLSNEVIKPVGYTEWFNNITNNITITTIICTIFFSFVLVLFAKWIGSIFTKFLLCVLVLFALLVVLKLLLTTVYI